MVDVDALPCNEPVKLPVNEPLPWPFRLEVLLAYEEVAGIKVILVAAEAVVAKDAVTGTNVILVAALEVTA